MTNRVLAVGLAITLSFSVAEARAQTFDYNNPGQLTNDRAKTLIQTIGIAAGHRSVASATPLGSVIGLDLGLIVGGVSLPQDFETVLGLLGNTQSIPSVLPLPRLSLSKGLPFGVNLTGSWVGFGGMSIAAGEAQWTFLDSAVLPSAALRVGYTRADIDFLETKTWHTDVVVSKKLPIIDPYIGLGMQFVSGRVAFQASEVPVGVDINQSASSGRFYVGLPITLVFLRIAAEYDKSFAGPSTISARFALSF
jgi:hypothetical protein